MQRDHTLCGQHSSNMSSAELLLQLGKDPGCFCDTEIMLSACISTLVAAPAGSASLGQSANSMNKFDEQIQSANSAVVARS